MLTTLNSTRPGSPATTYQNSGLVKPSVRFSLRLSTAARRQAPPSMRSVSRPTSAHRERAAREIAAAHGAPRSASRDAADRRAPAGCRGGRRGPPTRAAAKRVRRDDDRRHDASQTAARHDEEQHAAAVAVEAEPPQRRFEPLQRPADEPDRVPRVDGIARRRDRATTADHQQAARAQQRERAARHPVRHFSDQPSAMAASTSAFAIAVRVRPQRRAELRPAIGPARRGSPRASPPAGPSRRRHRRPAACRGGRDRAPPQRVRRRADQRLIERRLAVLFAAARDPARRAAGRSRRRTSLPSRRSGRARETRRACSSLRGRSASAAPRAWPSRGRAPISSPSFICGLVDVSGCRRRQRRGDAELIGAGAGREIASMAARHGQPLQRGALAFGHRHDGARQRGRRERQVDQQHRVDGAGMGRHLLDAGRGLAPARRIARAGRVALARRPSRPP